MTSNDNILLYSTKMIVQQPLSSRKKVKAVKDSILLFSLLCLVVVPALIQHMIALVVRNFSEDPRKNIKKLLQMIRNGTRTIIPIAATKDTLEDALEGIKSVCHMDLYNVYWYRKIYLQSWIQLCQELGNMAAVDILKRHAHLNASINLTEDSLLPINHSKYKPLLQCIELYTILIEDVTPALNRYMQRRGLDENNDPFRLLGKMVDEVDQNANWVGGRNNKTIVLESYDGRNSTCHIKLGMVNTLRKSYIKAWMNLCFAMRENSTGNRLRVIYNSI